MIVGEIVDPDEGRVIVTTEDLEKDDETIDI